MKLKFIVLLFVITTIFFSSCDGSIKYDVERLKIDTDNVSLGHSISLSEDDKTLIIGAAVLENEIGAVYIFTWSGTQWTLNATLTASDGTSGDGFGSSVSLSSDGSTALIGAPYSDIDLLDSNNEIVKITNAGAAYIFTCSGTTWSQKAKLSTSDCEGDDHFGYSVSLSSDGSTALLGVPGGEAAYIFKTTNWQTDNSPTAKLTASDSSEWGFFGSSVCLSSDASIALIGAPTREAAYIFKTTNWQTDNSPAVKLTASDSSEWDFFGSSVSLSSDGSTALFGVPGGEAAYIFESNSWIDCTETAKLIAPDSGEVEEFGYSVSLTSDGKTALISNFYDNALYLYSSGSWSECFVDTKISFALFNIVTISSDGSFAIMIDDTNNRGYVIYF